MKRLRIVQRQSARLMGAVRKNGMLLAILVALAIVAGSSRMLRGSLTEGTTYAPVSGPSSWVDELPSLRTCSATGTVFEKIWNFSELEEVFRRDMASVTDERLSLLTGPSGWSCLKDEQPLMPELRRVATLLPGWYVQEQYPAPGAVATRTTLRPVTWNAFSSIVAEYERVYECRLAEITSRALLVVMSNLDFDRTDANGNPTTFCCTEPSLDAGGCVLKQTGTACATVPTTNPQCDAHCKPLLNSYEIAGRIGPLVERMSIERTHARVALERTLNTLRSFETNNAIARQLNCYERASVDLQNELSLLSDASSCMPRIWDVITSIHDRKAP
ncbi:MAG: hypothetical protein PHZ00_05775 [Candidatus Peribacteraceae bacterium]|nr:hypothetical protein [Candidatus Peribacteraceae bacterium]